MVRAAVPATAWSTGWRMGWPSPNPARCAGRCGACRLRRRRGDGRRGVGRVVVGVRLDRHAERDRSRLREDEGQLDRLPAAERVDQPAEHDRGHRAAQVDQGLRRQVDRTVGQLHRGRAARGADRKQPVAVLGLDREEDSGLTAGRQLGADRGPEHEQVVEGDAVMYGADPGSRPGGIPAWAR